MKLFKRTMGMLLAVLMALAVLPAGALAEAVREAATPLPEPEAAAEGVQWNALQTSIYNASNNATVSATDEEIIEVHMNLW